MNKGKDVRRPAANRPGSRQAKAKQGPPTRLIAIVAAIAVVLVGGFIFISTQQAAPAPAVGNLVTESNAKGPATAKVTIVEFSDYQCPYCKEFAENTGRQIDANYVQSGQVRFIYKNRAVIGPESILAGQAALCAGEQGKYWDYHDKIFASQNGENRGAFSGDNLKRFARELGLDGTAFNSCLDSNKYASQVREETAESNQRGIKGTPSFFINNFKIEGAQPFSQFKAAIDAELRRTQ